jgi:hypothetical protein
MALSTFSYAPDKVVVLVAGVPLTGFGEDESITIEPRSELSTSKVGIDGDVTRSLNTDRRCRITIRLMQSSPSNDVLSTLVGVDLVSGGRMFPVTVMDLLGRTLIVAAQSWIAERPTVTFAREASEWEWVFETGSLSEWFAGGSNTTF